MNSFARALSPVNSNTQNFIAGHPHALLPPKLNRVEPSKGRDISFCAISCEVLNILQSKQFPGQER